LTEKKPPNKPNKRRGKKRKKPPTLSPENILRMVTERNRTLSKGEIAKHFQLKGEERRALREHLQELVESKRLKKRGHRYSLPNQLPSTVPAEIRLIDHEGDLVASPLQWNHDSKKPEIFIKFNEKLKKQPEIGDHALVSILGEEDGEALGKILRILPPKKKASLLGVVRKEKKDWVLEPTDRKQKKLYLIDETGLHGAKEGDFVRAEALAHGSRGRLGMQEAEVKEILGDMDDPKAASMIAIHNQEIPHLFPQEVIHETKNLPRPKLVKGREDLRDIPLVTIDGEDARDFDDAIWAEPDPDPENKGGWHLMVAIADVAHYVRPGSALDDEAKHRGNSTYFPDRVVPMLPEELSNDLCSLRPDGDRFCLAMHMWLDKRGELIRQKLVRGLMRSHARLTYEQVQRAMDGSPDDAIEPLMASTIKPVYEVFNKLLKRRESRGALEIDLPEYFIDLDDQNQVRNIYPKTRLDSHKVVEEFMVLANVVAARTVQKTKMPALFRNHEIPSVEKLTELSDFLEPFQQGGINPQSIRPADFNRLFKNVKDLPIAPIIHIAVLRAQMQAYYGPERTGHFGLALSHYAHFTSPIRRYSDLIVHRALIKGNTLGTDGLTDEETSSLAEIGEHISQTERRSMQAEREARDRYTALFMQDKLGEEILGHVSGMARAGIFITIAQTGADGFIPMRSLDDDYYIFDEKNKLLKGRKTNKIIHLGDKIEARIEEVTPLTGRIRLRLIRVLESPAASALPTPKTQKKSRKPGKKKIKAKASPQKESANTPERPKGKAKKKKKGRQKNPFYS